MAAAIAIVSVVDLRFFFIVVVSQGRKYDERFAFHSHSTTLAGDCSVHVIAYLFLIIFHPRALLMQQESSGKFFVW
jgi:hypothetical protein